MFVEKVVRRVSVHRESGSSNGYEVEIGKELYRLRITRLKETRGNKSWVITAL